MVVWAGLCTAVCSPPAPRCCRVSEAFISQGFCCSVVPLPRAFPRAGPAGSHCCSRDGQCWIDWNHPGPTQLPQVNDNFHSFLTPLSNYQETVSQCSCVKPARISPIFYSDPKEHSRTEKYTPKINTRNLRLHPTQKYPECVCHVQTVKPNA